MAKEQFLADKMSTAHKYVVRVANEIISEYTEGGYTLTLRQLYYQFVARDLIKNTQNEYKRLGKIIDAGRKMGMIDWDAIEDRTRNLRGEDTWKNPQGIIEGAVDAYQLNPWASQKIRVEVWIEKDALVGVIQPTCSRLRIDYFACRGYSSQSEAYAAGKRLGRYAAAGYKVVILHLGDHDPSGLDMTNDNRKRLSLFSGTEVDFRRIALNMDQIDQYNPPPNFAKESDSRTKWYRDEYQTDSSWELDALEPKIIDALIHSHVDPMIDREKWDAVMKREAADREVLKGVHDNWSHVAEKPWLYRKPGALLAEAALIVDQAREDSITDELPESVRDRMTQAAKDIEAMPILLESE